MVRMAARKAGQVVFDWIALSTKIPSVARAEFNGLRNRYENLRTNMESLPEKAHDIDWYYYSKTISKAGLVDSFRKQYESLKVPYPKDTESANIEAHKQAMEVEIKAEIAQAKQRAVELEGELNKLKAEKSYEDMTIDEYLADKPELKAYIEDDIKNQRWAVTGSAK